LRAVRTEPALMPRPRPSSRMTNDHTALLTIELLARRPLTTCHTTVSRVRTRPLLRKPRKRGFLLYACLARMVGSPQLTSATGPVTMFGKMAVEVVGRDEELDSLCAFLDRRAPAEGPTAFVLDGEAGFGKSAVW